ncbi:hypothetical protein B0A49_10001 [Cryomyces minteri]|uniref:Uncharacterized protein n=1 Tax=Cryomyces minteri TaxID=331657 RepID=A0A4U0WFU4_9PEZI|nr:hypothetical protein B0A49_10001 [Cryomyces minteri]
MSPHPHGNNDDIPFCASPSALLSFLDGTTASSPSSTSSDALHALRSSIASLNLAVTAPLEPATVAALRSSLHAFLDARSVAPCATARVGKGMERVFEGGEGGGKGGDRVERSLDGTVAKATAGEVLLWVVVVLVI